MYKKKLRTLLNELQGYYVKIGSKCNFFYCEKCDKNIFATLEKISNEYYEGLQKDLAIVENKWKNFDSVIAEKRQHCINAHKNKPDQLEIYMAKVDKVEKNLRKSLMRQLASLKKRLQTFTPILDRQVIYVFDWEEPREPFTKVIKITGEEMGKYWTVSEYTGKVKIPTNKKNKNDDEEEEPKKERLFNISKEKQQEIYEMATSGQYYKKDVMEKYHISHHTLHKILSVVRERIVKEKGYDNDYEI